MVMCQEMSQYKPKQIEETEMMPDQTNHGMVVACAAVRARSALGAEMPKGTVCAMGGSLKRIAIPAVGGHQKQNSRRGTSSTGLEILSGVRGEQLSSIHSRYVLIDNSRLRLPSVFPPIAVDRPAYHQQSGIGGDNPGSRHLSESHVR